MSFIATLIFIPDQSLTKIYSTINSKLTLEEKKTEVSALFAAVGVVFALLSAALSLWWFNRLR